MEMKSVINSNKVPNNNNVQQAILEIAALIKSIKYGYIQITIQNGKVVQIDKTEKFRSPFSQQEELGKSEE